MLLIKFIKNNSSLFLIIIDDDSDTFWNCFHDSYNVNPKEINGKVRVLSIIAERFTYEEIINKLKVSNRICLFF